MNPSLRSYSLDVERRHLATVEVHARPRHDRDRGTAPRRPAKASFAAGEASWGHVSLFSPWEFSVDPAAQDGRIGRALMDAMLSRVAELRAPGVRLVQISYHNRSLSLYSKLGFVVRRRGPHHIDGQ